MAFWRAQLIQVAHVRYINFVLHIHDIWSHICVLYNRLFVDLSRNILILRSRWNSRIQWGDHKRKCIKLFGISPEQHTTKGDEWDVAKRTGPRVKFSTSIDLASTCVRHQLQVTRLSRLRIAHFKGSGWRQLITCGRENKEYNKENHICRVCLGVMVVKINKYDSFYSHSWISTGG